MEPGWSVKQTLCTLQWQRPFSRLVPLPCTNCSPFPLTIAIPWTLEASKPGAHSKQLPHHLWHLLSGCVFWFFILLYMALLLAYDSLNLTVCVSTNPLGGWQVWQLVTAFRSLHPGSAGWLCHWELLWFFLKGSRGMIHDVILDSILNLIYSMNLIYSIQFILFSWFVDAFMICTV